MSQLLELAEHYYAVARDLEYEIQEKQVMAGFLNRRADEMSEANSIVEDDRRQRQAAEDRVDELREARAAIDRLRWLIDHGQDKFGSLWREATFADIEAVWHGATDQRPAAS